MRLERHNRMIANGLQENLNDHFLAVPICSFRQGIKRLFSHRCTLADPDVQRGAFVTCSELSHKHLLP